MYFTTAALSFFSLTLAPTHPTQNFEAPQTIGTTSCCPWGTFVVDLDQDGDNDIISSAPNFSRLRWFENDGSGTFATEQIIHTETFWNPTSIFAADGDLDGDIDVISGSLSGGVRWHENTGVEAFAAPVTIASTVDADNVWAVFGADLDGDGDLDVLSASENDDKLAWYENQGSGAFGEQQIITTQFDSQRDVFSIDLDGDGDKDVLSASDFDSTVAWYANDGAGTFGPPQVISSSASYAYSVSAGDFDADGDIDVLSASSGPGGSVTWYANDGSETFSATTVSSLDSYSALAEDLDGDGDLDILALGGSGSAPLGAAWFENDGAGNFTSTPSIDSSASGFGSRPILTGDLDSDGDVDIVVASPNSTVAWYRNLQSNIYTAVSCTPTDHSGGYPAEVIATGSNHVSYNRFRLRVLNLPPTGTTAYLFNAFLAPGQSLSSVPNPSIGGIASSGDVCIAGGTFGRHVFGTDVFMGSQGFFEVPVDLTQIPNPRDAGGGNPSWLYSTAALAGETWYWQCWFRDPAEGVGHSNFSSAISVTFQ